ncbi:hypothetical protein DKX38_026027 [Salix brachista]|uniref:Uncharacterized protein n=1 Tax=Salix brachista TaxID=2182728 RepID=A0A5N5JQL7_9ROSI|nr:hypothetical protein DKX38_026027 [Salix brachista]
MFSWVLVSVKAEKSKQDLKSKDVQTKKMEDTINGLDFKTKEKDLKYKMLQDKVKELEAQLLVERKLAHGALNKQKINPTQPLAGNTSNKFTIPLPSTNGIVKLIDSTEKENSPDMADQPETECLHNQTRCNIPIVIRNGSKRLNTMLKRSLQKKANMKPPLQKHMRRVSIAREWQKNRNEGKSPEADAMRKGKEVE